MSKLNAFRRKLKKSKVIQAKALEMIMNNTPGKNHKEKLQYLSDLENFKSKFGETFQQQTKEVFTGGCSSLE